MTNKTERARILLLHFTSDPKTEALVSEGLDELVHETMAQKASLINNGGLSAQVVALLDEGFDEKDLFNRMEDIVVSEHMRRAGGVR